MTRKKILKLATLLSCGFLAVAINGCKDSDSEKAAKEAKEAITNSNRLIKSSTDEIKLSESDMEKIATIDSESNIAQVRLERERIAKEVAARLSSALAEANIQELNEQIAAIETSEIKDQATFEKICDQIIDITEKIIKSNESAIEAVATSQSNKLKSALAELKNAEAAIRQAPSEENRRTTLQSASSLSLAAIYSSQARASQEKRLQKDINVHNILMDINKQVEEVQKASLEVLAANSARPDKAIEGLKQQLADSKLTLAETEKKLASYKEQYSTYKTEYETNLAKSQDYRDKWLQTLNQADNAQGSERYKLEMEATIQRVGKENLKEWANKWIAEGKDDEMAAFVNSSQDIIGGIHFETQAELAKLQMDSLATQVSYFETLINNTRNRISNLDSYIAKISTAEENTTLIETRIVEANKLKNAAINKIKAHLEKLIELEQDHQAGTAATAELFESAIASLQQYARSSNNIGEFEPESFMALAQNDMTMLFEASAEFYNSAISVLDNVRRLPELANMALVLSEDFNVKAQAAMDAISKIENPDEQQL